MGLGHTLTFLAPFLPIFCRKYPDVKIEMVLHMGRMDAISARLDVVIQIGRLEDSSYVVRKLGSLSGAFFAAPRYLKQNEVPKTLQDLAKHRVIMSNRAPGGARWKLEGPRRSIQEIGLDPYLTVPDPVVAYELAVAGLGIAMLPFWLAGKNDRLQPILEKWHTAPQDMCAVYPARQLMTPKLRVFLDELQSSLKHRFSVGTYPSGLIEV